MLCSHHFLHDRYCLCSLLHVPTAIFLFASPRNFVARHRRFGICENDFKLSLQKLRRCDTISSLPPEAAVFDSVDTILWGSRA